MRKSLIVALFMTLSVLTPAAETKLAESSEPNRPKAAVLLEIEPLFVDPDGIHPLYKWPIDLMEAKGGSYSGVVDLGPRKQASLIFKLAHERVDQDKIRLTLSRMFYRGEKLDKEMPAIHHEMGVYEAWSTTMLEVPDQNARVDLRVTPVLRPPVVDEPFDSMSLGMWLEGGPLIQIGKTVQEDRVIFRAVNVVAGDGLSLGIPGTGEVNLLARRFPGSVPCGWIRGTRLEFELAGQSFTLLSSRPILPEDPTRPGGGWVVYGTVNPNPNREVGKGFYSSFSPR
jgi:hypothetical protein